ncbi:hypothetical protein [Sorangium sp. So ce128]|uniref:hypothetical protein n=1 Tax=Sorangium sp. So ce128 TaxID=3133281 RepID=UPI003F627FBE
MAKGALGYSSQFDNAKIIDPPDSVPLKFPGDPLTARVWGVVVNGTDRVVRLYPYDGYPDRQWNSDTDVVYPGQEVRVKPFRSFWFEPDTNLAFTYTDAKGVRQTVAGTPPSGRIQVTAAPARPPFENRTGYTVRLYAPYSYEIPTSQQEQERNPSFGRGSGEAWWDIAPGGSYTSNFPVASFEFLRVDLQVSGQVVEAIKVER